MAMPYKRALGGTAPISELEDPDLEDPGPAEGPETAENESLTFVVPFE